jgi:hypothetical protein
MLEIFVIAITEVCKRFLQVNRRRVMDPSFDASGLQQASHPIALG